MASGSWGKKSSPERAGETPGYVDAYNLVISEIVTPGLLIDAQNVVLSSHTDIYKARTDVNEEQCFLIQQRKYGALSNYDRGIFYYVKSTPTSNDGGMLIYHIDEGVPLLRINDKRSHYLTGIEEAHGGLQNLQRLYTETYRNSGDIGDLWGAGKSTFSLGTDPSSGLYSPFTINTIPPDQDTPSGISINSIAWNSSTKTTSFTMGYTDPRVVAAPITGVNSPVVNVAPSSGINNGIGFTAALYWHVNPSVFAYNTIYSATIVLTAEIGYTFKGGYKNTFDIRGFTVNGIAPVFESNNGVELEFTVTFPKTRSTDYTKVHGYVYPMVDDDLGLGSSFLQMFDIVVELRPTFLTPVTTGFGTVAVLTTNKKGEFTINNIPYGNYVLVIKRPGYLIRCINVTISASDPDVVELAPPNTNGDNGVFNLWAGCCTGGFRIESLDAMMITELYNYDVSNPKYNPACDLDANGIIDSEDMAMLLININKHARLYAGAEDVDFET